jgi:hypothetical protein
MGAYRPFRLLLYFSVRGRFLAFSPLCGGQYGHLPVLLTTSSHRSRLLLLEAPIVPFVVVGLQ